MSRKILALAWREIYTTYTDRTLLLIMLITPLALATIIGSAFSGLIGAGGNDVPVTNIRMAVVNLDQGIDQNGQRVTSGDFFVNALVPPDGVEDANGVLFDLTDAVLLDNPEAARQGVREGLYAVALIIPADFSARLGTLDSEESQAAELEVFASEGAPVSAGIVTSVVTGIANQVAAGNIAVNATIGALRDRALANPEFGMQLLTNSTTGGFNPDFGSAIAAAGTPIQIDQQTVRGESAGFNPLVTLGSAQAVFFMTFTALFGVASLIDERKDGTLQRLVMTPTPRWAILAGKVVGTFLNCVLQVSLLVLALSIVGILLQGRLSFIWGPYIGGLIATIIAIALAGAGLGTLIAGLARTPEQANVVTTLISLTFGVLGGAFFSVEAIGFIRPLTLLTPNHWAVDAFTRLSQNQPDIGLNLLVLVAMAAVFFLIGTALTTRRLEF